MDNVLMQGMKNRDKEAFKEFYNEYKEKVYKAALLTMEDRFFAEYVLEETFLQAYFKIGSLERTECFDFWFNSIFIACCKKVINQNSMGDQISAVRIELGKPGEACSPLMDEELSEEKSEKDYEEHLSLIMEKIKRRKLNPILSLKDSLGNNIRDREMTSPARLLLAVLVSIVMFSLLTRSTRDTFIGLEVLPKNYTLEKAQKNGDIILGYDSFLPNSYERLSNFVSSVERKIPARVRVVYFNIFYPKVEVSGSICTVIEDLIYDGKVIRKVVDETRLENGKKGFTEYVGAELIKEEEPSKQGSLSCFIMDQKEEKQSILYIPGFLRYDNMRLPCNIQAGAHYEDDSFPIKAVAGSYNYMDGRGRKISVHKEKGKKLLAGSPADEVPPDAVVYFMPDKVPTKVEVYLFDASSKSYKLVSKECTFTVPSVEGEYIYSIDCFWGNSRSGNYAMKIKVNKALMDMTDEQFMDEAHKQADLMEVILKKTAVDSLQKEKAYSYVILSGIVNIGTENEAVISFYKRLEQGKLQTYEFTLIKNYPADESFDISKEPYLMEIIRIASGKADYDFNSFNKTVNDMIKAAKAGQLYNDSVYKDMEAGSELLLPIVESDNVIRKIKRFKYSIIKYPFK